MKTAIIGNCKVVTEEQLYALLMHYAPDTDTIVTGNGTSLSKKADAVAQAHGLSHEKIVPEYEEFGKVAAMFRNYRLLKESDFILSVGDGYSRNIQFLLSRAKVRGIRYRSIKNFSKTKWENLLNAR